MTDIESDIIEQLENSIPKIRLELLDKNVALNYDEKYPERFNEKYLRSVLFKWYSMYYLTDLVQLYKEVRFSYIKFLYHIECFRNQNNDKSMEATHKWKMKYYAESAIYRFYSVWEIIGRFINSYFNLKLDENKKNKKTEKKFYFQRDVLRVVSKKYYHPKLSKIFELHGEGQDILKYRIIKSHKKNPKIEGDSAFEMVKKVFEDKSHFILTKQDELSIDDFEKLCEKLYYIMKESIEICGRFFDVGHDETKYLEKNEKQEKSNIIVPSPKLIKSINIILSRNFRK